MAKAALLSLLYLFALAAVFPLPAQSVTPTISQPPQAIYTLAPVYRPEWAKQGLAGKGVVLVTIDTQTGKVTGARMQESTGSPLLDGSALQAYSQWRFKPGSVSQLRMPIEFRKGLAPGQPRPTQKMPQPALIYPALILAGFILATMIARRRRTG